jgi:DDE superfamily endonuclease
MLSGARMAGVVSSCHAGCRFFSRAVWDVDRLGLIAARFIVTRLLGEAEPITVVVDDTVFKRGGRTVHPALWTHDGAAQGGQKMARGNRWVVAGIVVHGCPGAPPRCACRCCSGCGRARAPPARSSRPDGCSG